MRLVSSGMDCTTVIVAAMPYVAGLIGWYVKLRFNHQKEIRDRRSAWYERAVEEIDRLYRLIREGNYTLDEYHGTSDRLGAIAIWGTKEVFDKISELLGILANIQNCKTRGENDKLGISQEIYRAKYHEMLHLIRKELKISGNTPEFAYLDEE